MKTWLRIVIACAAVLLIGFSAYKLISINKDYAEGNDFYDAAADKFIKPAGQGNRPETTQAPEPETTPEPGTTADPDATPVPEPDADLPVPPVEVDFQALEQINPDVVGWLYCENTVINYPVVQAEDNEKYLRRLFNGAHNGAGTLFLDCMNACDFSGFKNIIYGHHMRNDSMFGTLTDYKKQAYYDEHPVFWLLTPGGNYTLELIAGYVTNASDTKTYSLPRDEESLREFVHTAIGKSTFDSGFDMSELNNIVMLSTCSYEFNNARYVVIANMLPAGN